MVFMEFMLPRFFGWPSILDPHATDPSPSPLPHLARWYACASGPPLSPDGTPTRTRWDSHPHTPRCDTCHRYTALQSTPAFAKVRAEIWGYWERMEEAGQFAPIRDEFAPCTDPSLKFTYGVPHMVDLNYQTPPPPGQ